MTAFSKSTAYNQAVAIVSAGLQSGSIKLNGCCNSNEAEVARDAKRDADYLNSLINSLALNMTAMSER